MPDTVIITLVTIPVMEIVGVAVMASEKPAVMVTTSEVETQIITIGMGKSNCRR